MPVNAGVGYFYVPTWDAIQSLAPSPGVVDMRR